MFSFKPIVETLMHSLGYILTLFLFCLFVSPISVATTSNCDAVWNTQERWQVDDWVNQSCNRDGFYYLMLGRLHLEEEQYSEAISVAKQGISYADSFKNKLKLLILDSIYSKNKIYKNKGISKQLLKKYIAYYEQVEKTNEGLEQIVRLASDVGEHQAVVKYGSVVLRDRPSVEIYNLITHSCMSMKDYMTANQYLEQAYEFSDEVLESQPFIENAIEISAELGDEKSERFYRIIARKNGFNITQ